MRARTVTAALPREGGWPWAAAMGLHGAVLAGLVLVSAHYAGIAPILRAGLAVTVLPLSTMRSGQRALGPDEGLPALPPCRIGLLVNPAERSREVLALAEEIRSTLASETGGGPRDLPAWTGAEPRPAPRRAPAAAG